MKFFAAALVTLVVAVAVTANPQRQVANRNLQSGKNNDLQDLVDSKGNVVKLDGKLKFSEINIEHIEQFMKNKDSVKRVLVCFQSLPKCDNKAITALVVQVRTMNTRGNKCSTCNPEETKKAKELANKAVALMQQYHPTEVRTLTNHLGRLLF